MYPHIRLPLILLKVLDPQGPQNPERVEHHHLHRDLKHHYLISSLNSREWSGFDKYFPNANESVSSIRINY